MRARKRLPDLGRAGDRRNRYVHGNRSRAAVTGAVAALIASALDPAALVAISPSVSVEPTSAVCGE